MSVGRPEVDVAVVGAGASGVLFLAALARRARARVAWIERTSRFGPGLAYGTDSPELLLNVPAAKMGGRADRPEDFHAWLSARGERFAATDFVPRMLYGRYLEELAVAAAAGLELERRLGTVTRVTPLGDRVRLALSDGDAISAGQVVLAVGNAPPARPRWPRTDRLVRSAFAPGALEAIGPDEQVLLIGTGLTAIDAVLLLLARGHRGPLIAVSRHGLLPRTHAPAGAHPHLGAAASTVRGLVRELRSAIADAPDWRGVIDALRPRTAEIWRGLRPAERRRFLRHVRAFWEVHRHRLAPPLATRVASLMRARRLKVIAARLGEIAVRPDGLTVELRPRGGGPSQALDVGHAILCTGPASWLSAPGPIARLVEDGLAYPDPLGLGLLTDEDGALCGPTGRRLFTLGPPRRGELWESTAIPEIREQADALAARISAGLGVGHPADAARKELT
jgi:uncharacterized NAD(P)/FAD-binding protein YdhS